MRNFSGFGIFYIAGAVILLLLLWLCSAAEAQASCAPHDMVVERLADRYGETRRSMGIDGNNAVVELFASEETGTWTITVTNAHGLTCLAASGQAFEAIQDQLSKSGAPL